MSISFLRNGSVSDTATGADDAERAARGNEFGREPDRSSPPSALRELPRFERGLRKVLPRPLANSLLHLAPRQWTRGPAADTAPGSIETAEVGPEFMGNHDTASTSDPKRHLLHLAAMAEGFQSETARRAEIEHILDACKAECPRMDDDLAGVTFRLIASLQDTRRDDLLDRALSIVCSDPQLNVSPQTLMNDGWFSDEWAMIFDRMYFAVVAEDDTPERAAQLATLTGWIDHLLPSDQYSAIEKVADGIRQTDLSNRFELLTQLQTLANRPWIEGPESGHVLVLVQDLGGRWLSQCSTPDRWRALFPDLRAMFPDLAEAGESADSSFSAATGQQRRFAGAR